MAKRMGIRMKEEFYRGMAKELFDIVLKYQDKLTSSELIGILELHKQELIFGHLNGLKEEMMRGTND